ncbi:MAG: Gfo/Idh/MocA family protein [Phycisphaerales bacterium]
MLTRRTFLSTASALLAAPAFIPSHVLGRTRGRPGPNGQIGIGIIGVGIQGRGLVESFRKNKRTRVLAVCDVDTSRREQAKKTVDEGAGNSDCASFNRHEDLLSHPGIDAVVIGSPDHWHAGHVLDAARAGKDIYCEKPLCFNLGEAKRMIEVVREKGRVLQTGSQQRSEYEGRFRQAVEIIRSGRLGRVQFAHVGVGDTSVMCDLPGEEMEPGLDWDRWLGPAPMRPYSAVLSPRGVHKHFPDWRKYREYSGGMVTDWGAHHLDIVQWALDADGSGPVEALPPASPSDLRGARLRYANGLEVSHGGPKYGILFVGESGSLYVDRDRLTSTPESIVKDPLKDDDVHIAPSGNHHDNWLDCIESRAKPVCDVEIGARSVACCHLMNLAYWHKRPLKWDPAAWSFGADAEANGWRDYERRAGYGLS